MRGKEKEKGKVKREERKKREREENKKGEERGRGVQGLLLVGRPHDVAAGHSKNFFLENECKNSENKLMQKKLTAKI